MFRVTRPYLNLPVKPRSFFSGFWKNIISFILKGKMPFKIHIFFQEKKNVCLLNPKFSDLLPKIHLFFYLALSISLNMCFRCSKPSHSDGSFEYPQHMFWLRNKKTFFSYAILSGGLNTVLLKAHYWLLTRIAFKAFVHFLFSAFLQLAKIGKKVITFDLSSLIFSTVTTDT